MAKNTNLHAAKNAKNDEFYTQYNDIAEELKHYTKHFEGKIVFCNCDDPEWSKFWQYFVAKFDTLKLKKLISTHYNMDGSPSYALTFEGEYDDEGNEIKHRIELKGNGDFRSEECIEFLKEADIVCTNPPFSIAREDYIPLLYKYEKKFLIIGDDNWITYKDIFTLFQENKIWKGFNHIKSFKQPDGTEKKFGNKSWFTNLDNDVRHKKLILLQDYDITDYPKYDHYNVINVDKIKDIPNYDGIMGVPITFIDKYNPVQFEILGIANSARWIGCECFTMINKKKIYNRLLIKRREII